MDVPFDIPFDIPLALAWVREIANAVERDQAHLTELDGAIGDGDHGSNLTRGFTAVRSALDALTPPSVGAVLTKTGTTLISRVGGASGPLYGSAFRAMGKELPGGQATTAELAEALAAGLAALRELGGAAPGDKTIVDAWTPALDAFGKHAFAEHPDLPTAAEAAAEAAQQGAEATTGLQARKGRASYLGPRSIGHQDPGATSTALIFQALATVTATVTA